jgi:hypothetical protein
VHTLPLQSIFSKILTSYTKYLFLNGCGFPLTALFIRKSCQEFMALDLLLHERKLYSESCLLSYYSQLKHKSFM